MTEQVDAILFDVGGTLRRGISRKFSEKVILCKQILDLIGLKADPVDFTRLLDDHANAYRRWSRQELLELNETGFWTKWMLPDLPAEKISPLAVELNQIWRNADRIYLVLPDAKETILGLFRAGYRLGLVSNTTSSLEAPNLLAELGLSGCFEALVLSCQVGIRKPNPEILLEATRRMGMRPEQCAYIGNLPDRDVAAARNAGFSQTVILRDHQKPFDLPVDPALVPDHYIDNLKELLDLFPNRLLKKGKLPNSDAPVYDVSLSTMWAKNNFSALDDFFLAAGRFGFSKIELNHQMNSEMLASVDLGKYTISSIHEPCPAVISEVDLKKQDLLISSPDEERRKEGVNSIRRSIDLAKELGVRPVVVHAGTIQFDPSLENILVTLLKEGKAGTPEYHELKNGMLAARREAIGPCLEAVQKSLVELLDYAGKSGVRLGLENRYHFFDIPSQDEMALLLELADADRLGFIYDVGHAQALDHLGFYTHEDWLKRFANRMLGSHLHDAIGTHDHLAPGLGEIDFKRIAAYLPDSAFRTMEVQPHNSAEQVRNGLKILLDAGCIQPL